MGKKKTWNFIIGFTLIVGAAAMLLNGQRARASNQREPSLINSIRGDNLYRAYCASCHGIDAKGNGPMAIWLKVQPSDLTRIAVRYGGKFPLERVDRIISGEEPLPSGHGTRAMPVWGTIFSQVSRDQDLGRVRVDNLARYLRNLQVE